MTEEIWKDIEGYEGGYQVSNLGRVRSVERFIKFKQNGKEVVKRYKSKILQPYRDKDGYLRVLLSYGGKRKNDFIHRFVAQAFIVNPENKPQVNHINTIKEDNRVENLEWVTCLENIRHKWENGKHDTSYCSGINHYKHKFSKEDVLFIRKNYKHRDKRYGVTALSKLFKVSHSLISDIVANKTYKHI